jgi:predicted RND superfamily exporter protein
MRARFFDWWASVSARRPWTVLLVALLVFVVGAGLASTITPKLTWMDLLPRDEPVVVEFERILEEFGSFEVILVSVEGPDPEELVEFAEKYAERVVEIQAADGTPLVTRATYGEDLEFMLEHGLMLVKADELGRMLDSGLMDEPGLASVVESYNRMFKSEYVEEGDESLESKESDAARAIDSMWFLPRTLRWFLENQHLSDAELDAGVAEGAHKFAVGEDRYFSDDRSMLLIMVQPAFGSTEVEAGMVVAHVARDIFEELLAEHPAIAENYAGPWPVTNIWKAVYPRVEGDQAAVDTLRLELPYKAPAIAPLDHLDAGTGMTGMHIMMDDEYMTMFHDMNWALVAAFFLVLALFVAAFRMWTAPILAMVVLAMSITLAVGGVAVVLGDLTMIAMMFPVILLGLGVDYFIHILAEFTRLRRQGTSIEEGIRLTLHKTGRGILTGGFTTAVAFLALGLASFRGISDLGISAGIGVLCTLLTSFMVLPALLVVLHRRRERRLAKRGASETVQAESRDDQRFFLDFGFLTITGRWAYRAWPVTLVVVGGLTVFLGREAGQITWAKDMLSIEAEHLASLELNNVLEERFYINPETVVVSGESLEEAWRLTDELDDLSTIRMVDSISNLLPPPADQAERAVYVGEIRERIEGWGEPEPFDAASGERFLKALYQMDCNVITMRKSAYMGGMDRLYKMADRIVPEGETCVRRKPGQPRPVGGWPRIAASDDVKAIAAYFEAHSDEMPALLDRFQALFHPTMKGTFLGMANPELIGLDSLPQTTRDRYLSKDGSRFLITAYARGNVWNEDFQDRLLPELASVSDRITGLPVLFPATVERGAREGTRATLYAFIAIVILLLVDFWGFERGAKKLGKGVLSGVLTLIPLAIGAVWMVGCMTLLDIQLNMFNVIAVPLILGIGIDFGVHVVHRYRIEGPGQVDTVWRTVGRAILLTSLTTIAAFGSFATGLYQGLVGTGIILAIGIAICFFLSVYLLPALLRVVELAGVRL